MLASPSGVASAALSSAMSALTERTALSFAVSRAAAADTKSTVSIAALASARAGVVKEERQSARELRTNVAYWAMRFAFVVLKALRV